MDTARYPESYPLLRGPSKAPAQETREAIVVRCLAQTTKRAGSWAGTEIERLLRVEAAQAHARPVNAYRGDVAGFWAWADKLRDRRVARLICLDANRELGLMGLGEHEWRRPPLNRPGKSGNFVGKLAKGGRTCFEVWNLGNIHPAANRANLLTLLQAFDWIEGFDGARREFGLGRKLRATTGQQAKDWLVEYWADHLQMEGRWLQWHGDHDLHRFEFAVQNAQGGGLQISPAHLPIVAAPAYEYDFRSFYVSVMRNRLPARPKYWLPDGCPVGDLLDWIDGGDCAIADVSIAGERHLLTTRDLAARRDDLEVVHVAARYAAGPILAGWAEHAWKVRQSVEPEMQPAVKRVAVALWGYLGRKNYRLVQRESPHDTPWDIPAGYHVEGPDGLRFTYDAAGNYYEGRDDDWHRGVFHALAAHVLADGRRLIGPLVAMAGESLVQCHTDSAWTTAPIDGLPLDWVGEGLGQLRVTRHERVEWDIEARWVNGELDAARGGTVKGPLRNYEDHDDSPTGEVVCQVNG